MVVGAALRGRLFFDFNQFRSKGRPGLAIETFDVDHTEEVATECHPYSSCIQSD